MPCDTRSRTELAARARAASLKALEARLAGRTAQIVRGPRGLVITGWQERGGWCDDCAVRALRIGGSFTAKNLIIQAERSPVAVTAGAPHGHGH